MRGKAGREEEEENGTQQNGKEGGREGGRDKAIRPWFVAEAFYINNYFLPHPGGGGCWGCWLHYALLCGIIVSKWRCEERLYSPERIDNNMKGSKPERSLIRVAMTAALLI